jgi:dUTP pyrophosphatase
MLPIKVINKSNNPLPKYQTIASAGMDLHANLNEVITLKPGERKLIPTGLFIELPVGYEAQVRPRSGLALKNGITVLNSPGTVDADYRGEIKVLLINHGSENFEIAHSDRIAQMIIAKHEQIEWESVDDLNDTERGSGGYGSSGK